MDNLSGEKRSLDDILQTYAGEPEDDTIDFKSMVPDGKQFILLEGDRSIMTDDSPVVVASVGFMMDTAVCVDALNAISKVLRKYANVIGDQRAVSKMMHEISVIYQRVDSQLNHNKQQE